MYLFFSRRSASTLIHPLASKLFCKIFVIRPIFFVRAVRSCTQGRLHPCPDRGLEAAIVQDRRPHPRARALRRRAHCESLRKRGGAVTDVWTGRTRKGKEATLFSSFIIIYFFNHVLRLIYRSSPFCEKGARAQVHHRGQVRRPHRRRPPPRLLRQGENTQAFFAKVRTHRHPCARVKVWGNPTPH